MSPRSTARPFLSVITPLYNCLPLTQAMVASLRKTIPFWISYEVILVDDGSTDGTREWLKGLGAPFRVVLNEQNLGFGGSTNRGAEIARGRVLALLNNDLVLQPGWLSPMLWGLAVLGWRAGLVGNVQRNASTLQLDHAGIEVDAKCKPQHDREPPKLWERIFLPVKPVFAVTGACLIVRTSTWRRLGGFDEAFRNGCEDVDLCLKAREAGLINAVALHSVVLHHVSSSPGRKAHDESNSYRLTLRWRDRLAEEAAREWTWEHCWRDRLAEEAARGWTWEHFTPFLPEASETPDKMEAFKTALYLLRLRREPPAEAIKAKQSALDLELARWQKMFSS